MRKNAHDPLPITPETTRKNARDWLSIIRYGESGTIIQIQDDCEYRVPQIINNPKLVKEFLGPYYKKYLLAFIPIDQKDLQATIIETLLKLCDQKRIELPKNKASLDLATLLELISRKGFEVGLFLSHLSHLLPKKSMQPIVDLEHVVRSSKNLSIIVFTHSDITSKPFSHLTDSCSFLFDHVFTYPLYGETDTLQFCNWATNRWNKSIPGNIISEIIHHCGGYLWVIHQALRTYRDSPTLGVTHAVTTHTILTVTEVVWNRFSNTEKEIIRKIHTGTMKEQDTLTHEYQHLKELHIVGDVGKVQTLRMPILASVIEQESQSLTIQAKNNQIFVGKKDLTEFFTKKERVLLSTLLSSKKKIVPRDVLAANMWGNMWEEKYSDWAIDRLMSRIRAKFKKIGANRELIKTIKKKGFMFG